MEKENGSCAKCGVHGTCGQHHWMHIVIKIAIALIIFWAGVQFGELKGLIHGAYGGYGRGMMGGYYGGEVNRAYGPSMMYGWTQQVAPTKAVSATTTKK